MLYRIAQEGLTNVARHAGASRVELALTREPGGVLLRIADDGRGLAGAAEGAGIRGMRERAILIGAHLSLEHAARRRHRGAAGSYPVGADAVHATGTGPGSCWPTTTRWSAAGCG